MFFPKWRSHQPGLFRLRVGDGAQHPRHGVMGAGVVPRLDQPRFGLLTPLRFGVEVAGLAGGLGLKERFMSERLAFLAGVLHPLADLLERVEGGVLSHGAASGAGEAHPTGSPTASVASAVVIV